ncbi:hypothetical protein F2Q70_00001557 [Brassica cretica]|uniref:Uncharacterized protein n=1 Tax=Brassica cretica TaxID=69181 RepID=A0A3N6S464_BRACR|nr:hypothetical protein F2Q70_00001557 [Brassica cretica]KAF3565891.1 hypothetical protein DY000_02012551 [Brassica cretica]
MEGEGKDLMMRFSAVEPKGALKKRRRRKASYNLLRYWMKWTVLKTITKGPHRLSSP